MKSIYIIYITDDDYDARDTELAYVHTEIKAKSIVKKIEEIFQELHDKSDDIQEKMDDLEQADDDTGKWFKLDTRRAKLRDKARRLINNVVGFRVLKDSLSICSYNMNSSGYYKLDRVES